MDANTVRTLTESLMSEHGLLAQGWTYKPSNAKSYAGQCRYGNKIIAISVTWAAHMADHEVRDTILHEIAHAIAGHSAKHSLKWKNLHRSIGGTGETRFKPTDATLSSFMGRPVKTATKAPVTRISHTPTKKYVASTYAEKFDAGFTDFDSMFGY